MRRLAIILGIILIPAIAFAVVEYPTVSKGPVGAAVAMWWNGTNAVETSAANPMPISAISAATTYQGTMTLSAATSTSLTSGNVTMNNSTTLPSAGAFAKLTVINVGTANGAYICWFGGTCSATAGGELLAAGASDTVNLAGASNAPTLYSTSGTNISFRN